MRVLFVAPCLPFPPYRDSIRLRAYYLLRHLAPECELHLVSPVVDEEERRLADSLRGVCYRSLIAAPSRLGRPGQARLAAGLRATPKRHKDLDPAFAEIFENACRRLKPDLIHAQTMLTAGYALKAQGLPRVLDLVDSDALFHQKTRRMARSVRVRLKSMVRYSQFERLERERLPRFDLVTVTSPEDSAFIRRLAPGTRIEVIANGVDLDYFQPAPATGSQGRSIGIVGAFDCYENIDAARFFIRQVYPPLRKRFPDLELKLIGRDPEAVVKSLIGRSGISTTGELDDIRPPIADCSIIVSPVRLGSGVKNSVLQALSMGKAVVATSQATRALAGVAGHHYLVGDSPAELRDAIIRLLSDDAARVEMGNKARSFAEREHTWEKCESLFLDAYRRLIREHKERKPVVARV